jgi:hypothetical protein
MAAALTGTVGAADILTGFVTLATPLHAPAPAPSPPLYPFMMHIAGAPHISSSLLPLA